MKSHHERPLTTGLALLFSALALGLLGITGCSWWNKGPEEIKADIAGFGGFSLKWVSPSSPYRRYA